MHIFLKNSEYNFTGVLLTCNNTACGGIREPNAVAFSSNCERSELPIICSIARAVYIYIYRERERERERERQRWYERHCERHCIPTVRTSFRKCTPFLNSEYNFQFYRRVFINNLQQYRVRRNPRAQRCSVF